MPAVAGGIFGLLGGYLTDIFGRRRVLVWSILLYAVSGFAAGYSTTVYQLLFWRCCMFVGVCVEFVAAVAWLSELFANPKQREAVVGYTQAFGSLGGVMVTGGLLPGRHLRRSPAARARHARRVALHADVGHRPGDPADRHPSVPARVAEPGARRRRRARSSVRASASCSGPQFRRTTIVTTIMMACAYARGVRRDSAGAAHRSRARRKCATLPRPAIEQTVSAVQSFQEFGGLAGRIVLAFLAVRILSRRRLLHLFQIPGLILMPLVFLFAATSSLTLLKWGIFVVGLPDDRAVQFLGQLSAARVSHLPARHRRELRGERRRPDDRHVGGAAHHAARRVDAWRDAGRSSSPMPARSSARRRT